MTTEFRENEERGHSARFLIFIFLVCVATCGVFFSLGFLVGYNERGSHLVPSTEVITTPPVVPPTVNPPPDTGQLAQTPGAAQPNSGSVPDTEVIPSNGGSSPAPAEKPDLPRHQPPPETKPAADPAPAPAEVGQGITLQVAALRTKQDAQAMVSLLKSRGFPVFMVTPEYAHADDNLYRVQVGAFKSREEAEKMRSKLVQEGFKPFIKH